MSKMIEKVWPQPVPSAGDWVQFGGEVGVVSRFKKSPDYGKRGFNQGLVEILVENPEQPDLPFRVHADLYTVVLAEDIVEVLP